MERLNDSIFSLTSDEHNAFLYSEDTATLAEYGVRGSSPKTQLAVIFPENSHSSVVLLSRGSQTFPFAEPLRIFDLAVEPLAEPKLSVKPLILLSF